MALDIIKLITQLVTILVANCVFPLMTNLLNKGLREPDSDSQFWAVEFWEEDVFYDETLLDDDCQVTGNHILWGNWDLRMTLIAREYLNHLRNTNQLS